MNPLEYVGSALSFPLDDNGCLKGFLVTGNNRDTGRPVFPSSASPSSASPSSPSPSDDAAFDDEKSAERRRDVRWGRRRSRGTLPMADAHRRIRDDGARGFEIGLALDARVATSVGWSVVVAIENKIKALAIV